MKEKLMPKKVEMHLIPIFVKGFNKFNLRFTDA